MEIGVQLYTLRKFCQNLEDFSETLKKVADMGYRNVQVSGVCPYEPQWLKEQLANNNLKCVVTHIPPDRLINEPKQVSAEHEIFGCNNIGLGFYVVEDDVETETIEINTEDDKDVEVVIAPPVEAPEEEEEEEVIFVVVESMPEFPGGQQALFKYLAENVKYPVIAQENGIQGRVICQFVVNKDGSIVDVVAVRSSGEPSLDKEAIRVIQSMPKWKPGKQRGKPVRVKYTVPVNFRLQ